MKSLLQWLRATIARLRGRRQEPPPAEPKRRSNSAQSNREEEGVFYYLGDLLEKMDECHDALQALRKVDRDAYDYHARVGARIVPSKGAWLTTMPATRPAIGCLFMRGRDDGTDETIPANFVYFQKVKRPAYVAPAPGVVYRVTVTYMDRKGAAAATAYHVAISGNVGRLLREKSNRYIPGIGARITEWAYPYGVVDSYEIGKRRGVHEEKTVSDFAVQMLCYAIRASTDTASEELQVRCSKRGRVAMFTVSTKRTPYFFKDRDFEATVNGARRKIFHAVAGHTRITPDGKEVEVKPHYRGARRFTWGGYSVTITVPGLHHVPLSEFDATAIEVPDGELPPAATVSQAQAAKMIARGMQ